MSAFRFELDYSTQVRRIPNHKCKLPPIDDPIVYHVKEGILVGARRYIKRFFLVDHKNPNAKFLFRSSTVIYKEMNRHMQHYYYMIHPFSPFRHYWENIMIVVYLGIYMTLSFELTRVKAAYPIAIMRLGLDIFSLMDVALWFATGYYDSKQQKIVLKWNMVWWHYVKTYFVFDLMSSIPWSALTVFGDLTILYEMKLFMMLKLTRLPTLFKYIQNLCNRHSWSFHRKGLTFVLSFVFIVTTSSGFIFMMSRLKEHNHIEGHRWSDYIIPGTVNTACFAVGRQFMLVGIGRNIHTHDYTHMIFSIICLLVGSVMNIVLLAKLITLRSRGRSTQTKYKNLMQQIGEYMKYKELPHRLRDRIIQYVNFKYRKHIFKEADIMQNVSAILRQDLMLNNCKTMIERVDFFKELPTAAMLRLLSRLKSDIYLTNDVIVQAGVHGNAMYFIYNGTVAVYTMTGKEICHLSEGSHFGEIALIINEPRVATVVAIKECELFKLSRKDFHEALEPYPELTAKIRESAMARLETTMKMMEEEKLDNLMLLPRASFLGSRESSMDISTDGSLLSHSLR